MTHYTDIPKAIRSGIVVLNPDAGTPGACVVVGEVVDLDQQGRAYTNHLKPDFRPDFAEPYPQGKQGGLHGTYDRRKEPHAKDSHLR